MVVVVAAAVLVVVRGAAAGGGDAVVVSPVPWGRGRGGIPEPCRADSAVSPRYGSPDTAAADPAPRSAVAVTATTVLVISTPVSGAAVPESTGRPADFARAAGAQQAGCSVTSAADLRCSTWTRSNDVDPIGTAGSYSGFLLVDWPLPWPRDVSEIADLGRVASEAKSRGVRVQAVVPQGESALRVALYRWDEGLGRFRGTEAPAGSDPAGVAVDLLAGEEPAGWAPVHGTEVLVCGHGRRDRCCGSLGTSLAVELIAAGGIGEGGRAGIRRTSHTGGHRFAPTAIVLPEGTVWGYLDEASLSAVVSRHVPFVEVAPFYRGCSGLGSPAVQALERVVLEEMGWSLLDQPRLGEDLGDGRTSLETTDRHGRVRRWTARVVTKRVLPVPQCGLQPSGEEKTEPELAVEQLIETTGSRTGANR